MCLKLVDSFRVEGLTADDASAICHRLLGGVSQVAIYDLRTRAMTQTSEAIFSELPSFDKITTVRQGADVVQFFRSRAHPAVTCVSISREFTKVGDLAAYTECLVRGLAGIGGQVLGAVGGSETEWRDDDGVALVSAIAKMRARGEDVRCEAVPVADGAGFELRILGSSTTAPSRTFVIKVEQ